MLTFAPLNEAWRDKKSNKSVKETKAPKDTKNTLTAPKGFDVGVVSGGPVVSEPINDVLKILINDPEVTNVLHKYTDVYLTDITHKLLKEWIKRGEANITVDEQVTQETVKKVGIVEGFTPFGLKDSGSNEFIAYAIVGVAALVLFDAYIKRSCKNA